MPLDEDGVPVLTADPSALQDVTEAIRATLQNVNRIVADNQESVKNSLRNLETFTAALARNSEKIDNVMLRVDGVMGKADSLMLGLNTIAGGTAGGELNLMVKSIRELAEDFDKRSGALIADGRRTPRRHQPRREQFRPQSEPGDIRRKQQRRAGGASRCRPAQAADRQQLRRQRRAGRSGSNRRMAAANKIAHALSSTGEARSRAVIASEAKQSMLAALEEMDCFVALLPCTNASRLSRPDETNLSRMKLGCAP